MGGTQNQFSFTRGASKRGFLSIPCSAAAKLNGFRKVRRDLSRRDIPTIAQRFSVGFRAESSSRPGGTVEIPPGTPSRVPPGRNRGSTPPPKAEALGYFHMSLRDNRFGRKWEFPRGIGVGGEKKKPRDFGARPG